MSVFVLPGVLLLIALAACLMLLHKGSWVRAARTWTALIGALVIAVNTAFSMEFAVSAGLVAAVMNGRSPAWQHSASPAELYVFDALPIVVGLVVGGLAAAALLAGALYAITDEWIPRAWTALLISSAVVVTLVLVVDPGFLVLLRSGERGNFTGELGFSIVFVAGNCLYAACAGCWLSKASELAA